mmetsp:Transcript_10742/g.28716  ORF Transcript_10742/g.28716 Transcript_10742/m.28716 type:complete len:231 (+) Transcript_10742:766-1458(+)
MQIWPAFKHLPDRIRLAATLRFAPGRTMVGDLPPSSSVQGVRCSAAARATTRATAPLPVYMMWSQRSSSSAVASGMAPVTTATASGSTYLGRSSFRRASEAGEISEGFRRQQLPAQRAATTGVSARLTGKFHAERSRTTPLGSRSTAERPGCCSMGVDTFSGSIHPLRFFRTWSISATTGVTSPMTDSIFGRPRSARTASQTRSEFSVRSLLTPSSCSTRHSYRRVRPVA